MPLESTDDHASSSDLCLACGLCCNGALHSTVTVRAEDVPLVQGLGLTVEEMGPGRFGFRQPCVFYRHHRCGVYPNHPPTCQRYRCALVRKYADGQITFEASLAIVRTAKDLLQNGREILTGESSSNESLSVELGKRWDHDQGLQGSGPDRDNNAEFVLRAVALSVHLAKHFRLPKKKDEPAPEIATDVDAGTTTPPNVPTA